MFRYTSPVTCSCKIELLHDPCAAFNYTTDGQSSSRPIAVGMVNLRGGHLIKYARYTSAWAADNMVNFYACIGCSNRGNKNKDKSFFRLSSIMCHQGERTKELSEESGLPVT